MLIAARDEDGRARVFSVDDSSDVRLEGMMWMSATGSCCRNDDLAEFFCRNIPPGEKRVIDLAASTIVHVAPPKTAVEELVEACEEVIHGAGMTDNDAPDEKFRSVYTYKFRDLKAALARVKEAANGK